MPEKWRTFIAVDVPCQDELRGLLRQLSLLGSAVKPVEREKLHITLKFLGETPVDDVSRIAEVLQRAVAGRKPFEMELRGLGAFPRPERPSVLWTGLQGAEALQPVVQTLETELVSLGFPPERRAFTPHLTLARIRRKPPAGFFELFEKYRERSFGRVLVRSVRHYRSELHSAGARYTLLSEAVLDDAGNEGDAEKA